MMLRKANRSMELVWRGSESYGSETDMFTSQYPTGGVDARSRAKLIFETLIKQCKVVQPAVVTELLLPVAMMAYNHSLCGW